MHNSLAKFQWLIMLLFNTEVSSVVSSQISTKPGLNFVQKPFSDNFCSGSFRASNHKTVVKTNSTEFPLKAFKSEIIFHVNPELL